MLLALWSVYTAQGLHDKALAAANGVPADSPLSRKARFAAALSLIELKRFDGAFKELTALNRERPSPVLSNALGVVQLRRAAAGGVRRRRRSSRARSTPSRPTPTTCSISATRTRSRRTRPARCYWLREAVRFDAANGDAHLVMSAVLLSSGKTVEAQRELDLAQAARHAPGRVDARRDDAHVRPASSGCARTWTSRRPIASTPRSPIPRSAISGRPPRSISTRAARCSTRERDREADERAAARDLPGAVRGRAAPAARAASISAAAV